MRSNELLKLKKLTATEDMMNAMIYDKPEERVIYRGRNRNQHSVLTYKYHRFYRTAAEPEKSVTKEPEQVPIHSVEPSVPMPEPVETPEEPEEVKEPPIEENLPGQQDIETDYPEIAETGANPECETGSESDDQAAEPTPIQNILLRRADSLIAHIKASEWEDAMKDVDQLAECIKSIMGGNE